MALKSRAVMVSSSDKVIDLTYINEKSRQKQHNDLHSTSCAVSRFLGSLTSIFLTRSFALSEILGHGSDEKSISLCNTFSKISCSVSASK